MRRFLVIIFFLFVFSVRSTMALELEQATVKVSRMQAGASPLPVLVTIKTSSVAAENGFRLSVGSGWEVGPVVQISTNSLPEEVVAWPNLTINRIEGRDIIFDSGDMVAGEIYGFYITGGIGINPSAGDGARFTWQVATTVNEVVDRSQKIKVAIIDNDAITITGRVAAKGSDYPLSIVTDSQGFVDQNQEMTYVVTYASLAASATRPMVLTAEWGRGEVEDQPGFQVDVVDYVIGSASEAYGVVEPVVDLINRTITWTVADFPANSDDQQLSFKLKTNDVFTGSQTVTLPVLIRINAAKMVTVSSNIIYENYRYFSVTTPSPIPSIQPTTVLTPTVVPTSTVVPTLTVVPTPTSVSPTAVSSTTIAVMPIKITSIEITSLSAKKITIVSALNRVPSDFVLQYGLSANNLKDSMVVINPKIINEVVIEGLLPEKRYYFRIVTEGVKSEMYTFFTPKDELFSIGFGDNGFTIISKDKILTNSQKKIITRVVMPANQTYAMRLDYLRPELIKVAQVWVRDKSVLGIVSFGGGEPNTRVSDLFELENGSFVANLKSPPTTGWYEFYVRIYDYLGGISEQKIGEMRVVNRLRAIDESGLGVERAEFTIFRRNDNSNLYLKMPSSAVAMNPIYSESNGEVELVLPEGDYRLTVKTAGFQDDEVDFTINPLLVTAYPEVKLLKQKVTIFSLVSYYGTIIKDVKLYLGRTMEELGQSYRVRQLIFLGLVVTLFGLIWWSFSCRTKMPWWLLGIYLAYRVMRRGRGDKNVVSGRVVDGEGYPVDGAKIYLIDSDRNVILQKTISNVLGNYILKIPGRSCPYKLSVMCRGYEPSPLLDYQLSGLMAGNLCIVIKSVENKYVIKSIFSKLLWFCFVVELVVLLMIGLSLINWWLWIMIKK